MWVVVGIVFVALIQTLLRNMQRPSGSVRMRENISTKSAVNAKLTFANFIIEIREIWKVSFPVLEESDWRRVGGGGGRRRSFL